MTAAVFNHGDLPPMAGLALYRAVTSAAAPLMRWYLGRRADEFDLALRQDIAGESDSQFVNLRFDMDGEAMASDGFHPGPPVYAEWARRAAGLALPRL